VISAFSSLLPRLWTNWITLLGAVLTTIAALAVLLVFALELSGAGGNAYLNVFTIIALPVVFVGGLLLIPLGLYWEHRKQGRLARVAGSQPAAADPLQQAFSQALGDRKTRRRIIFVAVVTMVNVFIFGYAGSKTVTYMDSPAFCGTTCHTVMQPEWETYNRSPHSRVACVQCHIGPGASWEVKAKINGMSQLYKVLTHTYASPVPTPVEHLRPSRDTCEQCHWPQKFAGSQLKLFPHYKPDEKNTPVFNAMLLRIGGESPRTQKYQGIHWHVSANTQVRYEYLDRERNRIGKITVLDMGKVISEYRLPGASPTALGERLMDCVDCHNRPTHITDITPANAVDRALFRGALDPKIPFMAQVSREILARPGIGRDQAESFFRTALAEEYRSKHPDLHLDAAAIDKASISLAEIYRHNVYPEMKVTWNTHRNNIGHQDTGLGSFGCFRCHDKTHVASLPDGTTKVLKQDCDTCHEGLAFGEDPAKLEEGLQAVLPKGE
jgi:hypothetical protein